jgi:hypothetical protein
MSLSRLAMRPNRVSFHRIVSRAAVTLIGQIILPMTFGTQENVLTKYKLFEVVDFETSYNVFLGRPTLTKFMAIPHYAYLVLKMSSLNRVISIKGDVKHAYDYDRESCETVDMLLSPAELQEFKKALAESPQTRSCPRPRLPSCSSNRRTNSARQLCCPRMSPPRSLMWGIVWILNRNSCSSNSSRKIGIPSHESLLTC